MWDFTIRGADADWSVVEKLMELEYEKHIYYMRKLPSRMMLRVINPSKSVISFL